jgi:hypothetical protein
MVNVVGRVFVGTEVSDAALPDPDGVGRAAGHSQSTVLVLDGGERVLLTPDDVVPFVEGTASVRAHPVTGEGEYDVIGHRFTSVYRTADGQLVLQLDSGTYVTVNSDGQYLDVYSQEDMTEMIGDDPTWMLHRILPDEPSKRAAGS